MIDVVMPQMGESIVEGTLTRWLKKPGDKVERDEPLFEISTDKVDTEIPSPAAGTLAEVLVQEGTTVAIKTIVARVNDGADTPAAKQTSAPAPAPKQEAAPTAPKPAQAPAAPPPKPAEQKLDVGPPAAAHDKPSTSLPSPQPASAGPYPIEPDSQAA